MAKLESFFAQFKLIHYKKGVTILQAQENPKGVFYIKKGYVRVYSISEQGEELTLIIFRPEDFFPVTWAISGALNKYYVESITPVDIWLAPKEEFQKFLKTDSEILFELTRRIIIRLGGILTRMEYSVFGNAHAKVASILAICAQRFGRKEKEKIAIDVPLTHKDIASLIGITRETTSIEMKKLERKGLISYQKRLIVVKNLLGLKKESLLR